MSFRWIIRYLSPRMKHTFTAIALALLLGCSKPDESPRDNPGICVPIPPIAGLAERIAGDHVQVFTLIGDGQSAHAYEPTARELIRVGRAKGLLTLGIPFERALLKKIEPLYPDLMIFPIGGAVKRISSPHDHDQNTSVTHCGGATDPHIWLSARNLISIARATTDALAQVDPGHASLFRSNFESLRNEIERLHLHISAQMAPYRGKRFYVFHPSFSYFARDYGLEQKAIETDGKPPTPRQLAETIKLAKRDGARVIFAQPQFPLDSVETVAQAIEARIEPIDPLVRDVVNNLRHVADALKRGMSP